MTWQPGLKTDDMRILVFDNYDSFTYNLVHVIKEVSDAEVVVVRNDKLDLKDAAAYDKIVLSPGPGIPSEAGLLLDIIKMYAGKIDILGVCLGHQAIGEAFGGSLINLDDVHHGLAENVKQIAKDELFDGLPEVFEVGRYHSWIVASNDLPDCFEVTSIDDQGQIMSMRHKEFKLRGVQFHPESVLTPHGKQIIKNWINS